MSIQRRKNNYQLAREQILDLILSEDYQPGDRLPSRTKLSELLGIGLISVQQAVKFLEKEGIVRNIPRSGCYLKALPSRDTPATNPMPPPFSEMTFPGHFGLSGHRPLKCAVFPGELEYFGNTWRKIVLDFERTHAPTTIELIEIRNIADLITQLSRGELDIVELALHQLPFFVNRGYLLRPELAGDFDFTEEAYHKQILAGANYKEILWGIPVSVNISCLFSECHCAKDINSAANSAAHASTFWSYLEFLEKLAFANPGSAALLGDDDPLVQTFLKSADWNLLQKNMVSARVFDLPEFHQFIKRFSRYYLNHKIFHAAIQAGSTNALKNLLDGNVLMASGNTSWIPYFQKMRIKQLTASEFPLEPNARQWATGGLHVIPATCLRTSEALQFLNYLGSYEVQNRFAIEGRLVARKDACANLRIKGFNRDSRTALLAAYAKAQALWTNCEGINAITPDLFFPEVVRWKNGDLGTEDFLSEIRRRRKTSKVSGFFAGPKVEQSILAAEDQMSLNLEAAKPGSAVLKR